MKRAADTVGWFLAGAILSWLVFIVLTLSQHIDLAMSALR